MQISSNKGLLFCSFCYYYSAYFTVAAVPNNTWEGSRENDARKEWIRWSVESGYPYNLDFDYGTLALL